MNDLTQKPKKLKRCILFVPGKNPKPPANLHQNLLWLTLLEGMRRIDRDIHADMTVHDDQLRFIDWNYLYYQSNEDFENHRIWVRELLKKDGPSKEDIAKAKTWNKRLDMFVYNTVDSAPVLLRLLRGKMRDTATETNRYFENEDYIGSHIREQLKQELRPLLEDGTKVLLIGHSLGSVISYDTLWALSELEHLPGKVDMFLTLGSPLGMNYVQRRLLGSHLRGVHRYPANIRRWVNISADGDVIALDRKFAVDFKEMIDLELVEFIVDYCDGVYNYFHDENGLNCHRSYGYLINPDVCKVIAKWWKSTA